MKYLFQWEDLHRAMAEWKSRIWICQYVLYLAGPAAKERHCCYSNYAGSLLQGRLGADRWI